MTAEEILEVWGAMDPVIERTVEELLEVWAEHLRLDRTPEAALIPDSIRSTVTAYVSDPTRVLNEGRNLLLSGPVGTGKSFAAYWAAANLSRVWYRNPEVPSTLPAAVVAQGYTTINNIMTEIELEARVGFIPADEIGSELIRRAPATTQRVCVLDDLGSVSLSRLERDGLNRWLIARYGDRDVTIITTNAADVSSIITDPRALDRFMSRADIAAIPDDAPSLRRR